VDEEMFSLYHNNHDETFNDQSLSNGIGMTVRTMSGWGVKFLDYDNDGNMDIFITSGHPDDKVSQRYSQVFYREKPLLWRNLGTGYRQTYQNVSDQSGPIFNERLAGRGLAIGDFNNDGGIDVLMVPNQGAPILLRNNVGKLHHWLGLHLKGTKANPEAVGARVTWQAGNLKRWVQKVTGGGYLASHDPRLVLGIGQRPKIDWVEIKWPAPSTRVDRLTRLPIDRYITVVEGNGITG
jgi:hypothetical protein